jgi:hypothetical protein
MKRVQNLVTAMVMAAAVAGCDGSSDPKPAESDAFTAAVQTVVATSSDTALPQAVETIMAVEADSAAPVAVY